ncbi:bifunctional cytidylyltransferase/SDR family oxidoreductase [Escherichia coli]|uniref:bifunctional cytidylyltransferase/SDR family oxidoreductase n=1 Tax=Escherichia coli TaxID=562 RepID=UPI0004D59D65|nr:bifunctional cytidylyltransferase/SDR family oxidoreductase [Escherichia coli]EGJ9763960.1 bifunctional cytidylyltransferase/SDR family oxidoreductase [Escherichia coli]EGM7726953.1 bifunctional cytidylyltransferase/SDR family oxidoreductase [Escherichia coli]EHX1971581.1 bifunctional cytidylyltransferase/SDR family oxidoreductase [Escherichia coli]EIS2606111.1 bifunctional cytidylyltransferase/SDR family oxidoreductase [Escherichia coli]EIX5800905.1 bifunctional cytidylyltransferase/SDR fa
MKNIAVILSGGMGARFGGTLPKQFTKLAGKAVIEYTVEAFEKSLNIDEIIIVSHPSYVDLIWKFVKKNQWKKVTKVFNGGKERFDSTYSALQGLEGEDNNSNILLHDAVRPLINESIINNCIDALRNFEAVDVVIPSADTLVEVYDDGCISNIPNRAVMRRGQTPQAFKLGTLKQAYQRAINAQRFSFTCDCGVVRSMVPGVRVATVVGAESNMKVTHPIDLFIAEKLLQEANKISFNTGDNLDYIKGKNIIIFGGNSGIGLEIKKAAVLLGANVEIASRSFNNVDIVDIECVKNYLAQMEKKLGCIDYIINTAGVLIKKPIDMLTNEEVHTLININFIGAVNIAMASKQYLKKSSGMLLNFTSSSYTRGRSYYALYSSSKAAIVNFTQAIAEEWSSENIKVNCINPERTATPMRTINFGIEPAELLLDPRDVALTSLKVLGANSTGLIIDVRKDGR